MIEETALTFAASASDPDSRHALTFNLLSPPAGATINSTNGLLSWTPSESQGSGTNVITVTVTDNGSPSLSAMNSFTVTVDESNLPPVLGALYEYTIKAGHYFDTVAENWLSVPMPRQLCIEYSGAMSHIMNRGDRRENIFRDDEDRKPFLAALGEVGHKTA